MHHNRLWQCVAGWLQPLLVMLALALPASAQEFDRSEVQRPVALVADSIEFDNEARTVTAIGNVEVYQGERTLTAAKIVYNDATGRIVAEGDIVLRDPTGATVFADIADLDTELQDGLVEGARSVLAENIKLAAVEARRVDGRYNTLSKVVYSPCKVCADDPTPLWRIRARRVIHDEEARIIHYENATFDVLGVPIAWLPYFRHPDPSVERASGFLTPTFRSSTSTYGYGVQLPYYLVIDEQSDFTITPFLTTDDGLILGGEYRRAFRDGALRLGGSITHNDFSDDGKVQGHLDTDGRFKWRDGFTWGWDIDYATDDGYLRRFDFSNEDRLSSELYVERYNANGFVDASAIYFQSLRENEPTGGIPRALPVFDTRFDLPQPVLGGDMGLFLSGHALVRDEGRDASRLTIGADWERETVLPIGLALTGFAQLRGDLFSVSDDPAIREDFSARLTGHVGAEARFPLIWDGSEEDYHVLEPIVQFIAAPYGGNGQNIPIEDSQVTEFDETNVIDRNHFSGLDNFEEGPRVNLALRYQGGIGENTRLDATVGRVYRFRSPSSFSAGSGLADTESDFVTFWQASYDPYVQVSHRMRFSDDATITRNEFFGAFTIDPLEFRTSYAFFESDPSVGATQDREEVNAEALLRIDDNWSTSAFLQRDLQQGEFVRIGGALSYQNECCAVDLFLRRRFTDSSGAPASTSGGVRIRLLTLGDPG